MADGWRGDRMAARRQCLWRRDDHQAGGSSMPTVRTLTAALSLRRLLIVLSLAAALVAIPAVGVEEASARRTSESAATNTCNFLGGDLIEIPMDQSLPGVATQFYCEVPWGFGVSAFNCYP